MTIRLSRPVTFLLIGLIMAVMGCVVLTFLWIDRSISYTYLSASLDATTENARLVNSLLESEWSGITEQELLEKLEKLKAEVERRKEHESVVIDVNSEQGVIWFNEVRFEFESGRLKKIGM